MEGFIQRHKTDVIGVLHGFDRLRFRGTLRSISYGDGVERFLTALGVRYENYGEFAGELSEKIKRHAVAMAQKAGVPYLYVASSDQSKEAIAKRLIQEQGIQDGLVCVLRCVEPCRTFSIRRDPASRRFRFVNEERKCLHLYFYYLDREFGLMHVRLATWLPFGIRVCLNGREYLARRMQQAGIGFEQKDNCFTRITDLPRAQAMCDELISRRWERLLRALARRVNPVPAQCKLFDYYWSLGESEYATDTMFKNEASLDALYPALVHHAIKCLSSHDLLRYLGRRTHMRIFNGEVCTKVQERREGTCIRHHVEENSIKMYNKQGSVLRVETTINNPRRFKVRRKTTRRGIDGMRWIPMRFGLADLERRVEVSRAANQRYLEALSVVGTPAPAAELLDRVCRRQIHHQRPYRALQPVSPQEAEVFAAILDGRFLLRGFTNRDLRLRLKWPPTRDPQELRRRSGRATRLLRLLRAHGLIRKVSGTRYYRVTSRGQLIMTTALRLRDTDVAKFAA